MAEDITSLPKWAQRKIEHLERQVKELQNLVDETSNVYPDSNVKVSRFSVATPDNADWGLPKNSEVDFYLGNDQNRISVRHQRTEPGWLYVSAYDGALIVRPEVTNVVKIGVESR